MELPRVIRRNFGLIAGVLGVVAASVALYACTATSWARVRLHAISVHSDDRDHDLGLWSQCYPGMEADAERHLPVRNLICAPLTTDCWSLGHPFLPPNTCDAWHWVQRLSILSVVLCTAVTTLHFGYARYRKSSLRMWIWTFTGAAVVFSLFTVFVFKSWYSDAQTEPIADGWEFTTWAVGSAAYLPALVVTPLLLGAAGLHYAAQRAHASSSVAREVRSLTLDVGVIGDDGDHAVDDDRGCCDVSAPLSASAAADAVAAVSPDDGGRHLNLSSAADAVFDAAMQRLHCCVPISTLMTVAMFLFALIACFTSVWVVGDEHTVNWKGYTLGLWWVCGGDVTTVGPRCLRIEGRDCTFGNHYDYPGRLQDCAQLESTRALLIISTIGCGVALALELWTLWRKRRPDGALSRVRWVAMVALLAAGGIVLVTLILYATWVHRAYSSKADYRAMGYSFWLLVSADVLAIPATLCFAIGTHWSHHYQPLDSIGSPDRVPLSRGLGLELESRGRHAVVSTSDDGLDDAVVNAVNGAGDGGGGGGGEPDSLTGELEARDNAIPARHNRNSSGLVLPSLPPPMTEL